MQGVKEIKLDLRYVLKETIVGMVQPLLGDAEQQAWNHVLQWLTRLRLLEGVPFSYIVPSNEMLPNESIRFFHVDRNWLDALVDGALSTGVLDSRGALADSKPSIRNEKYAELINELNGREVVQNPLRASLSTFEKLEKADQGLLHSIRTNSTEFAKTEVSKKFSKIDVSKDSSKTELDFAQEHAKSHLSQVMSGVEFTKGGLLTGFLIRSSVVRDYPGLQIGAYYSPQSIGTNREMAYQESNRVETLRQVRLSESILLCIFNGSPTHLRIKEPGEGIRLGVEVSDGVDPNSAWFYETTFKTEDGELSIESQSATGTVYDKLKIHARKGTGDVSVLNIREVLGTITGKEWSIDQNQTLSKGGYVATQLMQFPYQQDFQYDSIHQDPLNNQKHSMVHTESILDDSDAINSLENQVTYTRNPGGDE